MENPGAPRRTPSPDRRTDPTGQLGLVSLPLADRVPGAPEGALLVEVDGVLDTTTRGWADNEIVVLLKDSEVPALVLDARGIEWISSQACGVILAALKTLRGRGGALVVIPGPAVQEKLELVGFSGFSPFAADPGEAAVILATAGRALGSPAADLPREENDGEGRIARFEPLPDLPGGLVVRYSGYMEQPAGAWFFGLVLRRVRSGYIRLALDFSGLQWVGAPGIGHLSGILKMVKPRGGRLILFGISLKIEEVLQLLELDKIFEIVDTEAEALALLKRNPAGEEDLAFPKIFKCPVCGARTRAARPLRGRCKTCKTVLAVDKHGKVFLG